MTSFVKYLKNSGKIIATGECPAEWLSVQIHSTDEGVVEGIASQDADYVSDEKVVARPTIVMPPPAIPYIVANVPTGSLVSINSESVGEILGDTFEFDSPVPGKYVLTITPPFPYIEETMELEVSED